jgi:hypothetical protein
MKRDRNYLINFYNATSTDDGKGEIETYEAWLERQLLSRIKKIEQLEATPIKEIPKTTDEKIDSWARGKYLNLNSQAKAIEGAKAMRDGKI